MNTLSILLYLTEVLYSFCTVVVFAMVLGWAGYALHTLISKLWALDIFSCESEEVKEKKMKIQARSVFPEAKWFWVTGILIFFLTLVPSRDTFYMILASEAGETVVNTPEAKEMMKDVREIIDAQLEKLKQ
jgi:hypothetical protein